MKKEENATLEKLENYFSSVVAPKMHDVGISHPNLRVVLSEPRRCHGMDIAVLIMPWALNLIAVDCEPICAQGLSRVVELPNQSVEFEFINDRIVGQYWRCGLLSTMLDFSDQDQALQTAEVIMQCLFDEPKVAQSSLSRRSMLTGAWRGN